MDTLCPKNSSYPTYMFAIEDALFTGYKVNVTTGEIIGLKGAPLLTKLRGTQRYPTVSLVTPNMPKRYYVVPVHKVVAYKLWGRAAFVSGVQTRHLNGITTDNRRRNLAKGSASENELDKPKKVRVRTAKIARASQGSRPLNAKLSDNDIREIHALRHDGLTLIAIANKFGISKSTAHNVCSQKFYGDVK